MALRLLKAGRRERFFSWISTLSICGIAIGVAALISVLSVIDGFESQLRERFLAANAHILIYRYPAGLSNWHKWQEDILSHFGSQLSGVSPFVHFDTMARHNSLIHGMTVRGIDPAARENVQPLKQIIYPPDALQKIADEVRLRREQPEAIIHTPAIVIGKGFASLLEAKVGDTIELVWPDLPDSQHPALETTEGLPETRLKAFQVVGIYDSGLSHYDNKLGIMSLPSAQELFSMGEIVTGLEIGLHKPDQSGPLVRAISQKYNYRITVKDWKTYNNGLFEAIRTEKAIISIIVALVAFVAGFNILTTLFVSVTQREKEIALLKALGARRSVILSLFLKQSALMGFIGGLSGIFLAALIGKVIENTSLGELPEIYLIHRLPVSYDPITYLTVALSGLAIALISGMYPAYAATRVSPSEGLTARRRD